MRGRGFAVAVTALSCAVAVGGCAGSRGVLDDEITVLAGTAESNGVQPGTGDFSVPAGGGPPPPGPQARKADRWVGLKAGSVPGIGKAVVNGAGLTLYRFDRDGSDPPTSNCSAQCAAMWPKLLVGQDSRLFVGPGIDENDVGSIPVGDGTSQITLRGRPVYRSSMDTGPGQANGQGVGRTWFVVAPDGSGANGGSGHEGDGQDKAGGQRYDEPNGAVPPPEQDQDHQGGQDGQEPARPERGGRRDDAEKDGQGRDEQQDDRRDRGYGR